MVRAILAGQKTQTRRVLTHQPPNNPADPYCYPTYWGAIGTYSGAPEPRHFWTNLPDNVEPSDFDDDTLFWPSADKRDDQPAESVYDLGGYTSPYGSGANCMKPAARLWVQETHRILATPNMPERDVYVEYTADDDVARRTLTAAEARKFEARKKPFACHPGRFMYRSLSRLTLEIAHVRVERLQAISEDDARAEGVTPRTPGETHVQAFTALWHKIHGEASWAANPWCWVITFKVLSA